MTIHPLKSPHPLQDNQRSDIIMYHNHKILLVLSVCLVSTFCLSSWYPGIRSFYGSFYGTSTTSTPSSVILPPGMSLSIVFLVFVILFFFRSQSILKGEEVANESAWTVCFELIIWCKRMTEWEEAVWFAWALLYERTYKRTYDERNRPTDDCENEKGENIQARCRSWRKLSVSSSYSLLEFPTEYICLSTYF